VIETGQQIDALNRHLSNDSILLILKPTIGHD